MHEINKIMDTRGNDYRAERLCDACEELAALNNSKEIY